MRTIASSPSKRALAKDFVEVSQNSLSKQYLPRIEKCLRRLSEDEIWWRPNPSSNSAGNLVLHLCGNVRQWVISGLGSAEDLRERDLEFAEHGPIPRDRLITQLRRTVQEACRVLGRVRESLLTKRHEIQGFRVSGLYAVLHVVEHFSHHAGQIIYITKLKRGEDLKFTRLPAIKKRNRQPLAKAHNA
ncbi:MAG TPA: DinB family protein [Verrucomicrobiae bacterium]|jgi:hypothetical protein|nr:DinB family protein [Verrucomicrobiae bacterium]